jgi:hypothetical protein
VSALSSQTRPDDIKRLVEEVLGAIQLEGKAYTLGGSGRARVKKALAAFETPSARRRALREIVCLAWFFEKKQASPHVAKELLDAAEVSAGDLQALREAADSIDSDTLHEAAKRYQKMLGEQTGAIAPRLGEKAPEGSVAAGTLVGRLGKRV